MSAADDSRVYGLLAEFEHAGALLKAAKGVRDAGFKRFDTHSPFPVHGMDKAMGLGQSVLGYIVFGGGLTGCAAGYLMQWWMGGVDYPLDISGKPFFAIEPSIPIMFELTVLFAALAAVFGMFVLNGIPKPYNPLFYSKRFLKVSDDGFFLHIEKRDPAFDEAKCRRLLEDLGAVHVETVEDLGFEEIEA